MVTWGTQRLPRCYLEASEEQLELVCCWASSSLNLLLPLQAAGKCRALRRLILPCHAPPASTKQPPYKSYMAALKREPFLSRRWRLATQVKARVTTSQSTCRVTCKAACGFTGCCGLNDTLLSCWYASDASTLQQHFLKSHTLAQKTKRRFRNFAIVSCRVRLLFDCSFVCLSTDR